MAGGERIRAGVRCLRKSERSVGLLWSREEGASAGRVGDVDELKLYLREIGTEPLLTAEEEKLLAKQIREGQLASDRLDNNNLAHEGRRALLVQVATGNGARSRMIRANLRLVVSVAKRYRTESILDFLDLIQEGNLGLMHAVEKFDPAVGVKFSTYAHYWIRQAIRRSIENKSRIVRIPVHMQGKMNAVALATDKLQQELGREPTIEQIARRTGFGIERVRDICYLLEFHPVSLERPSIDESVTLLDLIKDAQAESPCEEAAERVMQRDVDGALEFLSKKQKTVLRLRYGIGGRRARSLDQVGQSLGVSRERARQIEREALENLRRSDSVAVLKYYLD